MDKMQPIGGILAKNHQGLSQDWNENVVKKCGCGVEFNTRVWHRSDGRVLGSVKCPLCEKKESDEKYKQEALDGLNERIENQRNEWLENCGIPSYFACKTFADYDSKTQVSAFNAVKNLQWKFDDKTESPPKSLVLLSPGIYGVGKTHLACALINHIASTEKPVYLDEHFNPHTVKSPFLFTTENELLRRIRNTYNKIDRDDETKKETEDDVYKKLGRVSLLIIDDVGKVRPKDSSFTQGVYFNIIDQRYSEWASIILTTNLGYAELENHIGGACADRLREMCGGNFIKMAGKSYRQGKVKNVSAKP